MSNGFFDLSCRCVVNEHVELGLLSHPHCAVLPQSHLDVLARPLNFEWGAVIVNAFHQYLLNRYLSCISFLHSDVVAEALFLLTLPLLPLTLYVDLDVYHLLALENLLKHSFVALNFVAFRIHYRNSLRNHLKYGSESLLHTFFLVLLEEFATSVVEVEDARDEMEKA